MATMLPLESTKQTHARRSKGNVGLHFIVPIAIPRLRLGMLEKSANLLN